MMEFINDYGLYLLAAILAVGYLASLFGWT